MWIEEPDTFLLQVNHDDKGGRIPEGQTYAIFSEWAAEGAEVGSITGDDDHIERLITHFASEPVDVLEAFRRRNQTVVYPMDPSGRTSGSLALQMAVTLLGGRADNEATG